MNDHPDAPKALFLSPDGNIYFDTLTCSGILPAEFGGNPVPSLKPVACLIRLRLTRLIQSTRLTKVSPAICVHLVPSSNSATLAIGKGMAVSNFLKNYYRCAYSSVGNGCGWLCRGYTTPSLQRSFSTAISLP